MWVAMSSPARHDARAGALAHLAHQGDAGADLAQLGEVALHLLRERHRELARELPVALLDGAQLLLVRLADRRIEHALEAIGDAAEGRMHDQHAHAARRGARPRCARCWSSC